MDIKGQIRGLIGKDYYDTLTYIGNGGVVVWKGTSRCFADLNNPKFGAIANLYKFLISVFETIDWYFGPQAKVGPAINYLKEGKAFVYALKIVDSAALFWSGNMIPNKDIKREEEVTIITESPGKPDKKRIEVQLVTRKVKDYWQGGSNVLLGIASCFDASQYLYSRGAIDGIPFVSTVFDNLAKRAAEFGNNRYQTNLKPANAKVQYYYSSLIKDIPLFGNGISKPKDLFVFAASVCDLKVVYNKGDKSLSSWLKVITTTGKMMGIALCNTSIGRAKFGKAKAFMQLSDLFSQSAGALKVLIDCKKSRDYVAGITA